MTVRFRRFFVALLAVAIATGLGSAPMATKVEAQSGENARYAAIVVDAITGETLFSRYGEATRYPASLTKMMTLYLTFEALSTGKASLSDEITVSRLAASQAPSKLGLAAGQTITLDNAMRATAVRSANDMAMAIAEHIGGSQSQFAAMMTMKARELGMTQTRYVNPNGLPDSRQVTSAADLAILARAIMRDYPQYYSYMGQHDWAYNGRSYRNTNGLLATGVGYDGLKTGFTNASGYNLAASSVRNGRRLIVVVLGGRSSASRNAHVSELMNTGFDLEQRRANGEQLQYAQGFFEQRGFGIDTSPDSNTAVAYASLGPAEEDEDAGSSAPTAVAYAAVPNVRPQSPIHVAGVPDTSARVPAPRAPANTQGAAQANLTASLNGATGAVANTPPRTQPRTPPARTAPAGRWAVQVGAFKDERVARNWLGEINRRFQSQFRGAERTVQNAGEWYRSRFVGLTEESARDACTALSARRVTCAVIRPD
jgi:D-alanyl-D-alanine carboxypeptidase (penicillin-binding protein 5/6)